MPEKSAAAFERLARSSFDKGEYERSIAWAKQTESAARQEEDLWLELRALERQAAAWANLGYLEEAAEAATRLLVRARHANDDIWFLRSARLFAGIVADMDLHHRWDELRPLLLEGVELARRINYPWEEIYHLARLGEYAVMMDEWDAGYAWLHEALSAIPPDLEDACFFRNVIYEFLSELMEKQAAYEEAVRYARLSVNEAEEDGNPQFVTSAWLRLARAQQAKGEGRAALAITEKVLSQARARGWIIEEREANALLAKLRLALDSPAAALPHAERALELAIAQANKKDEIEGYLLLGQVQHALGQPHEARSALQRARDLAEERRYEALVQQAERLLSSL